GVVDPSAGVEDTLVEASSPTTRAPLPQPDRATPDQERRKKQLLYGGIGAGVLVVGAVAGVLALAGKSTPGPRPGASPPAGLVQAAPATPGPARPPAPPPNPGTPQPPPAVPPKTVTSPGGPTPRV